MKKVVLSAILLLTFAVCGYAQQRLFLEEFTNPATAIITAYGWTQSGSTTTNPLSISSPGLSFPGLTTQGNALTMMETGQDCYNSFTPQTSGSVYLSFLLQVSSAGTGDYFIGLSPSTGQTNYYARVHIKSSGTGFVMGLSKSNEVSGGATYGTTVLAFNTTYLIVVKHTFVATANTDDTESVYVFSAAMPATEPSTAEILNYSAASKTDPADLGFVTLRQGGGAGIAAALIIDEIMVSNSWSKITTPIIDILEWTTPTNFALNQNYPNPFNPSTKITFSVPTPGNYTVKVFDILGKEVATLLNNEQLSAGRYSVNFNARNLASGTYVYRLMGNNVSLTQKMLLMK